MELAGVVEVRGAVLRGAFRQEVAAVARGDDTDVAGRGDEAALERGLELAVAGVAGVEGEVVAEEEEALRRAAQRRQHAREVDEVLLVDLDDAEPAPAEAREESAYRRRLARPALPEEEHVVGREPAHELLDVLDQPRDRALDADEVVEVEERRGLDRNQAARSAPSVPAEGEVQLEDRRVGRRLRALEERTLGEREQALDAGCEVREASHAPDCRLRAWRSPSGSASAALSQRSWWARGGVASGA